MCQFDGNLKLCTCSGEIDTTKSHWTLSRKKDGLAEYPMFIGDFEMPAYDVRSAFETIKAQLNRPGGCFDFEYFPEDGDTLSLNIDTQRYVFVFDSRSGKWFDEMWDKSSKRRETFNRGMVKITR